MNIYGEWRVIFTGSDNCNIDYRRDHVQTRMLAVNMSKKKKAYSFMRLFKYRLETDTITDPILQLTYTSKKIYHDTASKLAKIASSGRVAVFIHGITAGDPGMYDDFMKSDNSLFKDVIISDNTGNHIRRKYDAIYFLRYPTQYPKNEYWSDPEIVGDNIYYKYKPEEVAPGIAKILLDITRKPDGTYNKIDVIAHSQGGVITRSAIEGSYKEGIDGKNKEGKIDEDEMYLLNQAPAEICVKNFITICSPHGGMPIPLPFTDDDNSKFRDIYNVLSINNDETAGLWETNKTGKYKTLKKDSIFIENLNKSNHNIQINYLLIGGTQGSVGNWYGSAQIMDYSKRKYIDNLYGKSTFLVFSSNHDGFIGNDSATRPVTTVPYPGRNSGIVLPLMEDEFVVPTQLHRKSLSVGHLDAVRKPQTLNAINVFLLTYSP